jgi:hypothetical protein
MARAIAPFKIEREKIMIRIILTSKKTNQEICYHTCKRLDEAERYAERYSRMEGIKTEIEVTNGKS